MKKIFESCKPSVRRRWLVFAAGVVWLTVGCGLMAVACFWLYSSAWPLSLVLGALSLALGLIVHSFGFSRIVRKNLERIGGKPEVVCLFAFQGWRSYFLILTMMLMGYTTPAPSHPQGHCRDNLFYNGIGPDLRQFTIFPEIFRRKCRLNLLPARRIRVCALI